MTINGIVSSANVIVYFFFSPLAAFYSFSSLIAMAVISNTVLNKSGENRHPCPDPDLRGKAFAFHTSTMLAVGLSGCLYYVGEWVPLYTHTL